MPLAPDAGPNIFFYDFPIGSADFGGHYSVVLDATETGETAESNRDRTVKWAQQMGKVEFIAPIVEAKCKRPGMDSEWCDWRPAVINQTVDFKGSEQGFGDMEITKREWNSGYGDWVEVEAEQQTWCAYSIPGPWTATYRVTYTDDRGCQRTVEDTCDLTVFSLWCGDMWFLDVQNPPDGYPNETTFVATGATTGEFRWHVASGAEKVELENHTSTMTTTDNNSVGVHATYFSATEDDVEIQFSYHRPQDEDLVPVDSEKLTVRRPVLTLLPGWPLHGPYGLIGFESWYRFSIRDQFNHDLPAPLPMNEDFGDDGDDVANNWLRGIPNGLTTMTIPQVIAQMDPGSLEYPYLSALGAQYENTYTYVDQYAYDNATLPVPNPTTLRPGDPGWTTNVYWRDQYYHAGSEEPGEGLVVKEHTLQMKRGCGVQE